jgi:transcriptional regulator with XRE-family HTH domain
MRDTDEPRAELARFLRTKRHQARPGQAGLPSTGGRRTPGLRREELSLLSGVSVTWYTWLEQGRDIAPSRQVIDALCRTLELSAAEREYVLRLAGHPYQQPADEEPNTLPAHGQRLLDAMGDSPAYAITPGWSIVAWNPAYEAFYPNIATVVPEDRNLLWLVFTDRRLRTMLTDWDADSRRFLAQFRAETGHRVHQPAVTRLVARLQAVSQEFRNGWADHDVEQFISRERTFTHPTVGDLLLEHHRLSLSDCPGVNLIMYTASPDTGTAEKLARLRIGETPDCV